MSDLFSQISKLAINENGNNPQTILNLFYLCKNELTQGNKKSGLDYCKRFKEVINRLMCDHKCLNKAKIHNYLFEILVLETPYSLDSYFQALEFNRPIKEQFYLPRRNVLMKHGVMKMLEDLLINDVIDEAFLSMPPRVGKTTLCVFVITWILGNNPRLANLYISNSGVLASAFYDGINTILTDEYTYCWHKIFPKVDFNQRTMCNAKETYLDVDKKKRYHSFTARSIDGSLNGACDCDGIEIFDDLVSGIEEALNQNRLKSLWQKVVSDGLSRAKQRAKKLWIGTRWSIYDPIGVRLESGELQFIKYRNIVIPALDDNDESNFEYLYNVGYDTNFYRGKRLTYEEDDDIASWNAVYQNSPIERSGLLFPVESIRTYEGELPDVEPINKYAFVDVAWGGGDYTCMPIIYQYENELYCPEIIFDNGNKKITQPKIVDAIMRHNLQRVKFEKNNGGDGYKEDIGRLLQEKSNNCLLTSAFASNQQAKEIKIFNHAPEIKQINFLSSIKRNIEYRKAIEQLQSFTIQGKNKHDDCPDALAEICEMVNEITKKVEYQVFERFF